MSIQFTILELVCSVCVNTFTTTIKFIDSIATFPAKPTTKLVSITIQASETQIKQLINMMLAIYLVFEFCLVSIIIEMLITDSRQNSTQKSPFAFSKRRNSYGLTFSDSTNDCFRS